MAQRDRYVLGQSSKKRISHLFPDSFLPAAAKAKQRLREPDFSVETTRIHAESRAGDSA
jgi:hypothetical protein